MSLGLDLSLSLRGSGAGLRLDRFSSARLRLLALPGTIDAAGGHGSAIIRVRDGTGLHTPGLPSLVPPTLHVAGSLRGVRYTAGSYVQGPVVMTDMPCTMFVCAKTILDNGGGRASILALSDNGAAERSSQLHRLFTNSSARQPQQGNGNAGFATHADEAAPRLYRCTFTAGSRQLWIDGSYGGSNILSASPSRSVTVYRAGDHFDASQPWDGVTFGWAIYAGAMSLREQEEADAQLRALFGIVAAPFRFPGSMPAATVTTGDPRFGVLPSRTEVIVDRDCDFFVDGVHLREGVVPSITATSSLPRLDSPPDRWRFRATAPGTFPVTFHEAGYERTTDIVAVPAIAGGAGPVRVLKGGDSNARRAVEGWVQILKQRLGARVTFLGSQTSSNAGYTEHCEGYDSAYWADFDSATSAAIPGGSPFWMGTGAFDIPGYIAAHCGGVAPDVLIMGIANDPYASTLAAMPATFAASMVRAHHLFDAWRAEVPSLKIALTTGYPFATNPILWSGSAALRYEYRSRAHVWVELLHTHFDPLLASGYFLIDTFTHLDCVRAYPDLMSPIGVTADPLHHSPSPGHEQLADVFEAFLAHHVY